MEPLASAWSLGAFGSQSPPYASLCPLTRARVRACVRVRACARVCAYVRARVCVDSRSASDSLRRHISLYPTLSVGTVLSLSTRAQMTNAEFPLMLFCPPPPTPPHPPPPPRLRMWLRTWVRCSEAIGL